MPYKLKSNHNFTSPVKCTSAEPPSVTLPFHRGFGGLNSKATSTTINVNVDVAGKASKSACTQTTELRTNEGTNERDVMRCDASMKKEASASKKDRFCANLKIHRSFLLCQQKNKEEILLTPTKRPAAHNLHKKKAFNSFGVIYIST